MWSCIACLFDLVCVYVSVCVRIRVMCVRVVF